MKSTDGTQAAKRAAGEQAAATVADGDTVGLGTGSTAAAAIRALGDRVAEGLDVTAVVTSHQSRAVAREAGVPLASLAETDRLDVAIDGADEVAVPAPDRVANVAAHPDVSLDASPPLVKGGGAAHAREKVVAAAADRYLVVVDDTKLATRLSHPVPVELLPDAEASATRHLRDAGGDPTLRTAERKDGPVVTDNGNLVVDCAFGEIDSPEGLATTLARVPGVVEHGLFVGQADALVVGTAEDGAALRPVE
ncbi:ribose-5-phosphate isomerase RpiA [Halobaculum sp. MBLA0147]|uniref:ribose-5-phosphate isomerase RpiA n=1 Tax=Halobaculum sp. MBLA0147 TaxID=3079934 RepID=UPI0035242F8E